jgi:NTE family protein
VTRVKTINLALQGGGAHGAFTWGVLEALLDHDHVAYGTVGGTSAGALNAVAFAAGFAEGGRAGARAKLEQVWTAVHKAGVPDLVWMNPVLWGLTTAPLAGMARLFSPYDLNPLGFDPLRQLLVDTIDFAAVRKAPVELEIVATDVATGRPRFFTRKELTVDHVLASACLPTLHHATEIDGRSYWDGGFSANPDIVNLALTSPVADTLIVLLESGGRAATPRSAREIAAHQNLLTFSAPLLRDVAVIEAVRESEGGWWTRRLAGPNRLSPLARHRFHMIEAGRHTRLLPAGSKMKPDWTMFSNLRAAGREEARVWLDTAWEDVGRKATIDLKARFLAEPRLLDPVETPPATTTPPIAPAARPEPLAEPAPDGPAKAAAGQPPDPGTQPTVGEPDAALRARTTLR